MPKGEDRTMPMIEKLRGFARTVGIPQPISVLVPLNASGSRLNQLFQNSTSDLSLSTHHTNPTSSAGHHRSRVRAILSIQET